MIRISIGTRNQNKIARVKSVVEALLSDEVIANGHDVESGVLDAPLDEQTYIGAKNRAESCNKLDEADYYIGLESGLVERYDQWFEEAWAVVITKEGR
ncbi:MAG TPA: DUF84 family protein, partial [Candidatus Saccharibacteria bacterium]|nr:DUF84 family protein [Candidatus Saccharibacteria bacterium]